METYIEKERRIPVAASVDVLILGGGPAGFSAAVNAGREGVSVMLIEQSGDIGGISTTGLMSHWTGRTTGGFYEEILDRSADLKARQGDNRRTKPFGRSKGQYLEYQFCGQFTNSRRDGKDYGK